MQSQSIDAQIRRFASQEDLDHFRRHPFSFRSFGLLLRAAQLYLQEDTTPPDERTKVIERNLSLAAGYGFGLGQNTTKWLTGDDIASDEIRKETPTNLLAGAGWALRGYQLFRESCMASEGFRAWLRESDLNRLRQPPANTQTATSQTGLYNGPMRLARGNFGERAATEALAADGHTILSYKPAITGTNQGGVDMVTLRNGVVYFIDNKALSRSGNISSVPALTTNFANNRAAVIREFTTFAGDLSRPATERAMFQQAIDNINWGNFVRAVTNANLARDTQVLSGVTQNMQRLGIQFIDVMR